MIVWGCRTWVVSGWSNLTALKIMNECSRRWMGPYGAEPGFKPRCARLSIVSGTLAPRENPGTSHPQKIHPRAYPPHSESSLFYTHTRQRERYTGVIFQIRRKGFGQKMLYKKIGSLIIYSIMYYKWFLKKAQWINS